MLHCDINYCDKEMCLIPGGRGLLPALDPACGGLEVRFLQSTRLQRSDNKKAVPLLTLPKEL